MSLLAGLDLVRGGHPDFTVGDYRRRPAAARQFGAPGDVLLRTPLERQRLGSGVTGTVGSTPLRPVRPGSHR